jgi:hypothetical protein
MGLRYRELGTVKPLTQARCGDVPERRWCVGEAPLWTRNFTVHDTKSSQRERTITKSIPLPTPLISHDMVKIAVPYRYQRLSCQLPLLSPRFQRIASGFCT